MRMTPLVCSILRWLVMDRLTRVGTWWHGTTVIAEGVGRTRDGVWRILRKLEAQGYVRSIPVRRGKGRMWRAAKPGALALASLELSGWIESGDQ